MFKYSFIKDWNSDIKPRRSIALKQRCVFKPRFFSLYYSIEFLKFDRIKHLDFWFLDLADLSLLRLFLCFYVLFKYYDYFRICIYL